MAAGLSRFRVVTLPPRAEVQAAAADSILLAVACLISYWVTTRVLSLVYSVSPARPAPITITSASAGLTAVIIRLASRRFGAAVCQRPPRCHGRVSRQAATRHPWAASPRAA